jgi:hypothetical protein
MKLVYRFQPHVLVKRLSVFALAAAALLIGAANASAQANCWNISGRYQEAAVPPERCTTSAVNLCIEGEYTAGPLHGTFFGAASTLVPSADVAVTNVLFFTTDSVIHAQFHGKQGDLTIKNAGAFRTAGNGEIMDIQYITGGSGDLAGASGVMQAVGTFSSATGTGVSEYTGTICLP